MLNLDVVQNNGSRLSHRERRKSKNSNNPSNQQNRVHIVVKKFKRNRIRQRLGKKCKKVNETI